MLSRCDCQLNRRILICTGNWGKSSKLSFWRMCIQSLCLGFISLMGNFWGLVNIIKRAQTYLAVLVSNITSTWILWWLWNNSVIFGNLFALHFQWKWSRKKEERKETPQRKNRKLKIHPLSLCLQTRAEHRRWKNLLFFNLSVQLPHLLPEMCLCHRSRFHLSPKATSFWQLW